MEQKINNGTNVNQKNLEMPESAEAMDRMKYEIATEMGLNIPKKGKSYDWRMVPAYYCGAIGGEMVKRMMQFAEKMAAEGHNVLLKEEGEGMVPHDSEPPTPYEGPSKPIH
jgi:hypothetical protein